MAPGFYASIKQGRCPGFMVKLDSVDHEKSTERLL